MDLSKAGIVARFELAEAARSRLAVMVVGLYAVGAAVGAWIFIKTLQTAEEAVRNTLAEATRVPPESLPPDIVREKALPRIAEWIDDERLRETLLSMEPLGIFYGFMALNLVAGLVLLISAGTHARDIESGAARYALFRVDRVSWAVGKTAGQAVLLAAGLLVGALVTGFMGLWLDASFRPIAFVSLVRASVSAWLYGLSFLGLFGGASMVARSPLTARGLSFALLVGAGIGHGIFTTDLMKARGLSLLRFAFPAEYKLGLWYTDPLSFGVSVVGLLAIGTVGFSLGASVFRRRDA